MLAEAGGGAAQGQVSTAGLRGHSWGCRAAFCSISNMMGSETTANSTRSQPYTVDGSLAVSSAWKAPTKAGLHVCSPAAYSPPECWLAAQLCDCTSSSWEMPGSCAGLPSRQLQPALCKPQHDSTTGRWRLSTWGAAWVAAAASSPARALAQLQGGPLQGLRPGPAPTVPAPRPAPPGSAAVASLTTVLGQSCRLRSHGSLSCRVSEDPPQQLPALPGRRQCRQRNWHIVLAEGESPCLHQALQGVTGGTPAAGAGCQRHPRPRRPHRRAQRTACAAASARPALPGAGTCARHVSTRPTHVAALQVRPLQHPQHLLPVLLCRGAVLAIPAALSGAAALRRLECSWRARLQLIRQGSRSRHLTSEARCRPAHRWQRRPARHQS